MNRTKIEWTDWSVNPIKLRLASGKTVNACTKVSAGCTNCYAESITKRWWPKAPSVDGEFPGYRLPLLERGELVLLEHELEAVLRLDQRIANGKADASENKVFWGDMSDLFGEWVPFAMLDKCFAVMALTRRVVHQVLTKRPERMAVYFESRTPKVEGHVYPPEWLWMMNEDRDERGRNLATRHKGKDRHSRGRWPLPNVWLGTSVEDQKAADVRVPALLGCPAAVRFLSCEPLLGAVDLTGIDLGDGSPPTAFRFDRRGNALGVGWIIVGGESGPVARPCDLAWFESIIGQCRSADVPVFVKQLGRYPLDFKALDWPGGTMFDRGGRPDVADKKGGTPAQWPQVLRVRQMPGAMGVQA